jgi:glyoxylase-like metal-dependent hydrolase (beta-lactamase superfamily II)
MMKRTVAALVAVLSLGACASTEAVTDAPQVRLYAMDCGRVQFRDLALFSQTHDYDGQTGEIVAPCYLIRHPAGDLLWDTGFPEALADIPGGLDWPLPPSHVSVSTKLTAQLRQLGLTPSDIEYLSLSHGHPDHSGNAGLFAAATWIVDADERAAMFSDAARASPDFANYAALEQARTILIGEAREHDVFGDGSVVIIQAPGHTPGHCILRVNLANAGPVLLTGDLWHLPQSRARRTMPVFNTSREQTLHSMDEVEALAAGFEARVVRQHVVEDFSALPTFPAALD